MSTQAIRSVLLRYREACGEEMLPGQREVLESATAEVEAIERAARHYNAFGEMVGSPGELLRAIAEDAP